MAKRSAKRTRAQLVADHVSQTVGAGFKTSLETVDFADPDRPKTCLEVDFPILPINRIAAIEGNAGKPIYQVSKWWARRRSSVFRAMLLAAATKAPDDIAEASKLIWDAFYRDHGGGSFNTVRVADIFMGGGTTIVEGSRLGMQLYGTDLNPIAWFVTHAEMAGVSQRDVDKLLADVEEEVKPQVSPYYACSCPRGHVGKWIHEPTGAVMSHGFDPLSIPIDQRCDYRYEGPEVIYVFWSKHAECRVAECSHRTPIMSTPLMATKHLTVRYWNHTCSACQASYDIEEKDMRIAPGVPLVISDDETPFAVLNGQSTECPICGNTERGNLLIGRRQSQKKSVALSVLVHPAWMVGEASPIGGQQFGGSAADSLPATAAWNNARSKKARLIEVRGPLPEEISCPETGVTFKTNWESGTQAFRIDKLTGIRKPKKSSFACQSPTCGAENDVLNAVRATGNTGPVAAYAIQGYCPECKKGKHAYGGRFFSPADKPSQFNAAYREWDSRKNKDLSEYWPRSQLPFGFMTHMLNGGLPNHGFTHWWKMFNPRQLLIHAQLLRAIASAEGHDWKTREVVLSAFQQYLRNQNMFCFWDISRDCLAPALSNANFHPKSTVVENCVFAELGRGNWQSCAKSLRKASDWATSPWDLVHNETLQQLAPELIGNLKGKSSKVFPNDPIQPSAILECISATDLSSRKSSSFDIVVTDPPFGGLLHYAELADFFYVWLRLVLRDRFPDTFGPQYTPKALEAVSNRARQPEDPDGYYQRLLTAAWSEAHRILKPGGLLAFTFHHSEDAPWVAVLESLFDAGFYLEATYPIRSDEIKGGGEFGSRKIEYDIIHVCRKRESEPTPVSWAKMRRAVVQDVQRLKEILEQHRAVGLPDADIQVIKPGQGIRVFFSTLRQGSIR